MKLLTAHRNKSHKIMYCKKCSEAFNNKTTYKRHVRSHSNKGVSCSICGKSFVYQSQLNTHSMVHNDTRFSCNHNNCTKSFKNQGDLTHHLKLHTAPKHKCPDCDYEKLIFAILNHIGCIILESPNIVVKTVTKSSFTIRNYRGILRT